MIQVIERFHKIIEQVATAPDSPHSLTELAKAADISVQACSNIIRTMTALGYLENAGARKGFSLGPQLHFLTRGGPYKKYLADTANPYMEELCGNIRELVVIVVECAGKRLEIIKLQPDSMIQIRQDNSPVNADLFASATGTLLLAFKDEDEFKRRWESRDTTRGNLLRTSDYNTARQRCLEIAAANFFISEPDSNDEDSRMNRASTMAFPIFEYGKVTAALGCMIPGFRFQGERRQMIINACRDTAKIISEKISGKLPDNPCA